MNTFSGVICTANRPGELDLTLASISALQPPLSTGWDVVVVDNGTDLGTATVVDKWAAVLPVRRIVEPRPGLVFARQRALDEVASDYLLYLDDDETLDPALLVQYEAAVRSGPAVPYFGGPIIPDLGPFPTPTGALLREVLPEVYSAFLPAAGPDTLIPGNGPWGGNMLIARAAVGPVRFDSRLGFRGARGGVGGEETLFIHHLSRHLGGVTGVLVREAVVHHRCGPARQTWAFARGYGIRIGRGEALIESILGQRTPTRAEARWYWRQAGIAAFRSAAARLSASAAQAARLRYDGWRAYGAALEMRDLARNGVPS